MTTSSFDERSAQVKEHERRAAVILDGMYQFVALLNPRGDILEVNRAALEGAGHQIQEIRGKPFWTARWWQVSEQVQEQLQVAIQRAAAGEFVRYEVDIYGEQSGLVPITIDFSLQPIRGESGEVEYLLPEGRNITERKRAEEQVARQARELRALNERLKELDRLKTRFFANVSHEFRTPLTLMLGPLEDALAHAHGILPVGAAKDLEVSHRNALRLLKLVNTMLDFSRIEAGRIQASYHPTDLAALTAELASNFRSACEKAGLRLVVDCPAFSGGEPVYIDRDMWEKIVLNLLSNAFKFTLNGEIEVCLQAIDGQARLTVRDTGVGVPSEELPRMFERFHRVEHSRGRTHEGTGIGMALVYELTKLHGGEVRVESVEGQGTTFTVSIPTGSAHLPQDCIGGTGTRSLSSTSLAPGIYVEEALRWLPDDQQPETAVSDLLDGRDVAAPFPPSENGPRPRIVLADDNADMREYVRRLLSQRFDVEAVANGREALDISRQRHPDLILTDVMMPELDGFGLLEQVRADPSLREIPVIMLSARAGEEARIEGVQAGADDYLVKPFSARELLARVGTHLDLARVRQEAAQAVRASEQRFARFMQHLPGLAWIKDLEGRYVYANDAAERVFRTRRPELYGKSDEEVFPLETAEQFKENDRRALASDMGVQVIESLEQADGIVHHSIVSKFPIVGPDGKAALIGGMAIDITDLKRAEEALWEADRRKNEFLAMLAHELRNPLAPIRNALQIMRLTGGNAEAVHSASEMMERQIGQMVRLVDDLLDVSRISRGKIELRKGRVELGSVVNHAVEAARPLCASKGLELTVTLPPKPVYVDGDPTRLAQVVGNLLNNACKFTERGGRIGLTVEQAGQQAVIRVRDAGIGIAADQLTHIFDMFTQVDTSLERSQSGLGIGLTLVKNLVEMHDGTVKAYSAGLGHGSAFVVCLPILVETAKPPQPEPTVSKPMPTTARRILVVDDNQDSAESLAILLELTGNKTHTAYDGLEAVEAAATFKPDVVLLDLGLPKMNGFEAARKIREQPWGKKMVLVALTGWGQDEDRRKSKDAGFDAHLVKPVDYAALMKLLASLSPERGVPANRVAGGV